MTSHDEINDGTFANSALEVRKQQNHDLRGITRMGTTNYHPTQQMQRSPLKTSAMYTIIKTSTVH